MTDIDAIKAEHGMVQARNESIAWRKNAHLYGVSYQQGHRNGWWAAVRWLLEEQAAWDSLTDVEALTELGKEHASIYYPIFKADPVITIDCPSHGAITVDKHGICDMCGRNFKEDNT